MAELASGQKLASRFTLIRRLGRGGMGEVWLARDESLGTDIVVKFIASAATPDQLSLLRQECRNSRRLTHPAIVRVFDFHEAPPAAFISMEFVGGGDVGALRGRPVAEILTTLMPLVEALEYAHREGVVHRDLKPANVLLDEAGRPRLSDFGIAGVLRPEAADLRLAGGGSRQYASPQQLAGEPADPADDIHGLGVLLGELLSDSGRLPPPLLALLDRMTALTVAERPAGMEEVRGALEPILATAASEPTAAPQVVRNDVRLSPPPKVAEVRPPVAVAVPRRGTRERPERHPYWWITPLVFVVLASVAAGVFLVLPGWVEKRGLPTVDPEVAATQPSPAAGPEASNPRPQDPPAPISESEGPTVVEEVSAEPQEEVLQPIEPTPPAPRPRVEPSPKTNAAPRLDRQEAEFQAAMSDGLGAFESGEPEAAKKAFERALALRPASAEAVDGLARAEAAIKSAAIRQHREAAAGFEEAERWRDAEAAYAAALAVDPTLRFARRGQQRAAERAALHEELEFHLGHPDRLAADSVLDEAREALATARSIEPSSDLLRRQIEQLEAAIETATTPIRVLLLSDNLTQVVVYKVGRLGTFDQHSLELRPGTYTVVGSRAGYRDVRRQLRVVPGGENKPLTVRCEEPI